MLYLLFKSLHIIAIISWFVGLFYLVRLFVYHTEAYDKEEPARTVLCDQFHVMESRLYRIICNPGMMLSWTFGLGMIYLRGWEWFGANPWLHVKIVLVILLTIFHVYNKKIIALLKERKFVMSSFKFRLYNEIPTLFMLSVVLLAVFKNAINYGYTIGGIIAFGAVLFILAKMYKKIRKA